MLEERPGQGHVHKGKACHAISSHRPRYDINKVSELNDGSNVHTFIYKGDPNQRQHIGLMAQEVRKRTPSAVHKLPSGYMAVDYSAATALSQSLGAAR